MRWTMQKGDANFHESEDDCCRKEDEYPEASGRCLHGYTNQQGNIKKFDLPTQLDRLARLFGYHPILKIHFLALMLLACATYLPGSCRSWCHAIPLWPQMDWKRERSASRTAKFDLDSKSLVNLRARPAKFLANSWSTKKMLV